MICGDRLEVETPVNDCLTTGSEEAQRRSRVSSSAAWTLFFAAAIWILAFFVYRSTPYLRNGSDVIFSAKLRLEREGVVFPAGKGKLRLLIFGDSKVLAGFMPREFDRLAEAAGERVESFNSGFPGTDYFLPPLQTLCSRGQAPDVLLMTLPWRGDPPRRDIFHFIPDDHAMIQDLFPFRNMPRDLTAFLMNAPGHGGLMNSYREAREAAVRMVADRGYYLVQEQSHFPQGRIPDDFHLASDTPTQVVLRQAPLPSAQLQAFNQLLQRRHIRCFYVPQYMRQGEVAPAPAVNQAFAQALDHNSSCRLLGPEYYLYPNRDFADQTHMNADGARLYTQDIFDLVKAELASPATAGRPQGDAGPGTGSGSGSGKETENAVQ